MWLKRCDAAEHRHRRRRRRPAAGDRLGGRDRRGRSRAVAPVPDHLPVDAAAFLGAGAVQVRRLRPRRRADDAGGRRAGVDAPADPRSMRWCSLPVGVVPAFIGIGGVGLSRASRARSAAFVHGRLDGLTDAASGDARPMRPAKGALWLLRSSISLRSSRLSGRGGAPAHAGAAGSWLMASTIRAHRSLTPSEKKRAAPRRSRSRRAGCARRAVLHGDRRQARTAASIDRADVRLRCSDRLSHRNAPSHRVSRRCARLRRSAWSARPTRRCRSTSCSARSPAIGGTHAAVDAAVGQGARPQITVRFDANVAPGMPWHFAAGAAPT